MNFEIISPKAEKITTYRSYYHDEIQHMIENYSEKYIAIKTNEAGYKKLLAIAQVSDEEPLFFKGFQLKKMTFYMIIEREALAYFAMDALEEHVPSFLEDNGLNTGYPNVFYYLVTKETHKIRQTTDCEYLDSERASIDCRKYDILDQLDDLPYEFLTVEEVRQHNPDLTYDLTFIPVNIVADFITDILFKTWEDESNLYCKLLGMEVEHNSASCFLPEDFANQDGSLTKAFLSWQNIVAQQYQLMNDMHSSSTKHIVPNTSATQYLRLINLSMIMAFIEAAINPELPHEFVEKIIAADLSGILEEYKHLPLVVDFLKHYQNDIAELVSFTKAYREAIAYRNATTTLK